MLNMLYGLCFMPAIADICCGILCYIMLLYRIYILSPYAHFIDGGGGGCVANILLAFHLHFTPLVNRQFAFSLSLCFSLFSFNTFYNYVNLFIMLNLCEHVPCNKMHSLACNNNDIRAKKK